MKDKIEVIPPGINKRFTIMNKKKIRKKYGFKNEKIILYVGRLEKEKGVDSIINIFSKLNIKNAKLVLVGSGREESKLRNLVKYSTQELYQKKYRLK